MALYLKYRPQNLDELIGQEPVKKILLSAFQNNKLSHAYLFVGPRGTGKTSTARILAKMVNCLEKNAPCNKCEICKSITDGSNLDLIEIDAASNRGIDDIRSLRETIKLSPAGSNKKVYIIDEVHMLTAEAFNALLKTLEEPPAHAIFILATTEGQKVPQTILSRVTRLDFKLATLDEMNKALQKIIKAEKLQIEAGALDMLTKYAEGSFRDGVKLLDQVSSLGKITEADLIKEFSQANFTVILDILGNLAAKDSVKSLMQIENQVKEGVDIKNLTLTLLDTTRNLVFIKNNLAENLVKDQYSEEHFKQVLNLAGKFSLTDLVKILGLLQESIEKLKFASIVSLPLEIAVIELCTSSIIADPIESVKIDTIQQTQDKLPSDDNSPDILKLKERWNFVLETVRPYNFSLEALLRSAKIAQVIENKVILEVPYSFHQRILESPKNKDLLESIFSDILSKSVGVSTILGVGQ